MNFFILIPLIFLLLIEEGSGENLGLSIPIVSIGDGSSSREARHYFRVHYPIYRGVHYAWQSPIRTAPTLPPRQSTTSTQAPELTTEDYDYESGSKNPPSRYPTRYTTTTQRPGNDYDKRNDFDKKPGSEDRGVNGDRRRPLDRDFQNGNGDRRRPEDRHFQNGNGDRRRPIDRESQSGNGDRRRPIDRESQSGNGDRRRPEDRDFQNGNGDRIRPIDRESQGGNGDRRRPIDRESQDGNGDRRRPEDGGYQKDNGDGRRPEDRDFQNGKGGERRPIDGESQSGRGKLRCPKGSRLSREDGRCHELGSSGSCNQNMAFYSDPNDSNDEFGYCDCFQDFNRPVVYHIETDKCYFVFQQAYCKTGEWLVLDPKLEHHPVCKPNPCRTWAENISPNWNWLNNGAELDMKGFAAALSQMVCVELQWQCTRESRRQQEKLTDLLRRSPIEGGNDIVLKFDGANLACMRQTSAEFPRPDASTLKDKNTEMICKEGLYNKWRSKNGCKPEQLEAYKLSSTKNQTNLSDNLILIK